MHGIVREKENAFGHGFLPMTKRVAIQPARG
jgi:hypothetical protein